MNAETITEMTIAIAFHFLWLVIIIMGIMIIFSAVSLFLIGHLRKERATLFLLLGLLVIVVGILIYYFYYVT